MKLIGRCGQQADACVMSLAEFQKAPPGTQMCIRDREYEARFDRVELTCGTLEVTEAEIQAAYRQVGDEWLSCLRQAIASIRDFHERQKKQSWMNAEPGRVVGSRVIPMKRVGVYAPVSYTHLDAGEAKL